MAIKEPAKAATRPPRATAPHGVQQLGAVPRASSEDHAPIPQQSSGSAPGNRDAVTASGRAHSWPRAFPSTPRERLLTPGDILSRLSMTSADPAKWMRRTFEKHGVPYVHACGKIRATEAQYLMLMDKITCSPPVALRKATSTKSEARSCSATSASTSKRSVQERVIAMLRRT